MTTLRKLLKMTPNMGMFEVSVSWISFRTAFPNTVAKMPSAMVSALNTFSDAVAGYVVAVKAYAVLVSAYNKAVAVWNDLMVVPPSPIPVPNPPVVAAELAKNSAQPANILANLYNSTINGILDTEIPLT